MICMGRTKILPKQYKRDAFYLYLGKEKYRVYKVEYFFSNVGESWILEFFISYRDLVRFKKSRYAEGNRESYWFADITLSDINDILKSLRDTGVCKL